MSRIVRIAIRLVAIFAIVLTPLLGNLEPGAAQGSGAVLRLVMRGCPEGFNPSSGNFDASCTIPLDAPDASVISSDYGTAPITSLPREWDGGYVYYADPGAMSVAVSGLAPVLRDGYQVWNYDQVSGDTYTFHLAAGETREARVFYYYNLDGAPAQTSQDTASTPAAYSGDEAMLTLCASNRHGVAYPSLYFKLPPEATIAAGLMIVDSQGNLVPEWTGVREGECDLRTGFQLYEYVPSKDAIVEYCDNGEDKTGPANTIGANFVDAQASGEAVNPGLMALNWDSAPKGLTPGPCSMPIGRNGPKLLSEIEGSWNAELRSATFYADGTGEIVYVEPSRIESVVFYVDLDVNTYPLQATIVEVWPAGNPDLDKYPKVGDVLIVDLESGGVLRVEPLPDQAVYMCRPDDSPHTFNQKCFD